MRSNASSVTCADWLAAAQAVGTSSCFEPFIASMNPAIGRLMPATPSKISAPCSSGGHPPPRSNCANVALLGAKVLVSC
jgi:hypothetical protein